MKKTLAILVLLFLTTMAISIVSCSKQVKKVSNNATPLEFQVPGGFPEPQYKFEGNPLTVEGLELGRKLFYDGRLSKDGNFPCSSCHQQFAAFSTYDHDLSHGYNNQFTTRNAPGIFNMVWQKELQWDGGKAQFEGMSLAHISASNEMAEDINTVAGKLKQDSRYRQMFKAAFGDEDINTGKLLKALTQYVASLVSANSKYDRVKRGEATYSPAEQTGYTLFQSKCEGCHKEPLFTDNSYRNTGLPLNPLLKDFGRMHITNKKEDSLKFKVPSLRNVLLTFPYGHDGRFYSVDNVLNHYGSGIQNGPTLDPLIKNGIAITAEQRYYLKSFLATLTDSSFISDKRFVKPE